MFETNTRIFVMDVFIFIHQAKGILVIIMKLITRRNIQKCIRQSPKRFPGIYNKIKIAVRRDLYIILETYDQLCIVVSTFTNAGNSLRDLYFRNRVWTA